MTYSTASGSKMSPVGRRRPRSRCLHRCLRSACGANGNGSTGWRPAPTMPCAAARHIPLPPRGQRPPHARPPPRGAPPLTDPLYEGGVLGSVPAAVRRRPLCHSGSSARHTLENKAFQPLRRLVAVWEPGSAVEKPRPCVTGSISGSWPLCVRS